MAFVGRFALPVLMLLVCVVAAAHVPGMMMVGGMDGVRDVGDITPEDNEIQRIANQVRPDVETMAGRTFSQFIVKKVGTQVVAGTNYFMKVQVSDGEYIHIRVYKMLDQSLSVSGIKLDQTADSQLSYF